MGGVVEIRTSPDTNYRIVRDVQQITVTNQGTLVLVLSNKDRVVYAAGSWSNYNSYGI